MIKAIIIDDERAGIENLSNLICEYCSSIMIVGTAGNIFDGKIAIESIKPDLVFLDIHMPGGSGFRLLELIDTPPAIVFVTAYADCTVKAIRAKAFDYIMKPLDIEELVQCEHRLLAEMTSRYEKTTERLKITDGNDTYFIDIHDIFFMEGVNNYTRIHYRNGTRNLSLFTCKTLKHFQDVLPAGKFFRVHKSFIINLEKVITYTGSGAEKVIMESGHSIKISRRNIVAFKKLL